jgi:hypothetical protein
MSTRLATCIGRPPTLWSTCSTLPAYNRLPQSPGGSSVFDSGLRRYINSTKPQRLDRSVVPFADDFRKSRSALAQVFNASGQRWCYRQLSTQEKQTAQSSVVKPVPTPAKSSSDIAKELVTDDASKVSDKQQSLTDWRIIKRLASNIWPKGEWEIKTRVVGALGLLVVGKVSSAWHQIGNLC